jgi:transposase
MTKRRVDMDRLQELVRLHRMGTGAREVARMLRMSPNTEREYRQALEKEGLLNGPAEDIAALEVLKAAVERQLPMVAPPQMVSTAEPLRDKIVELAEKGVKARAISDRLRLEDPTFSASYWAVRRVWRRWRKERGVRAEDVAIPVETGPGEVAQVDFGYVGKLRDAATGMLRKAWVFVMVLAFSRRMAARIVFDQKIETWLRVHIEAFAELDGAPAAIVPDNLKAAVIRAAFGVDGAASLNRSYRELARHYGIKIDPAPIYAPKKKGKVESSVKYVKANFFAALRLPLQPEDPQVEDHRSRDLRLRRAEGERAARRTRRRRQVAHRAGTRAARVSRRLRRDLRERTTCSRSCGQRAPMRPTIARCCASRRLTS